MRLLIALLCVFLNATIVRADLSLKEKRAANEINATIMQAGKSFAAGEFDEAGGKIREAMKQISAATTEGSPEFYDSLEPAMKRISKAHTLLELEGVSLPPFRRPKRPDMMPVVPATSKPTPAPTPPTPSPDSALSFTKTIAPILVNRCGRCHVSGSKGQFNMASYSALMKGPPSGVVVFPGDLIGSLLIETIETGDMPRGGRMGAGELDTLKAWVKAGAKFDGPNPDDPIGASTTMMPVEAARPELKRATGRETVSFASDVAPLLVENCNGCHIDAMQNRGGLRMDTFAQILRGGDSGAIVTPGKGEQSLLVRKLRGMEGDRMPAGGRPAFSEESIKLISTWIDEGATLDGASESQPLRVMSQLAWARKATPAQISERRGMLAQKNMKLATPSGGQILTYESEHFFVIGSASQGTIELVAELAEKQMKTVKTVVDAASGEAFFNGRATLFVMPRSYEYGEFARMVEGKESLPSDWSSHWNFDGIDAYVSLVASDRDEEDEISSRLTGALVSLAVSTRGGDVPRWLAEVWAWRPRID
jgi:mono/diheme cytochrome c family protein